MEAKKITVDDSVFDMINSLDVLHIDNNCFIRKEKVIDMMERFASHEIASNEVHLHNIIKDLLLIAEKSRENVYQYIESIRVPDFPSKKYEELNQLNAVIEKTKALLQGSSQDQPPQESERP